MEEIRTHFMFNDFLNENNAIYEVMWKNMVEPDGPHVFFFFTLVTGHAGPEGSRKLRLLDFLTTAQYGGRLSALRIGHLYLQGIAGTHFH